MEEKYLLDANLVFEKVEMVEVTGKGRGTR